MRVLRSLPAILLVCTACTGGTDEPNPSPTPAPLQGGGTLRVGMVEALNLDPHVGYSFTSYPPGWELMRCCLLRTLVSYNGRSADEGGARLFPDLAARMPEVSDDGLTWTFELKQGIRYAPPLEDVEVTAGDFVRALERSARPAGLPGHLRDSPGPYFFSVIQGYEAFAADSADSISGIEALDDHTLIVRVTEPIGDLPNRLALPAAAPLPPNPFDEDARLGVAEGLDFSYDSFLVSTGPYMIEGSEAVDLSLPTDVRAPAAGLILGRSLTLVRNPSWDPATDELRDAFVDRIEIMMGLSPRSAASFAEMIERNELDLLFDLRHVEPPGGLQRWRSDLALSERLVVTPIFNLPFIGINLAQPPLDDLHVRRAVGLALNRAALARITTKHLDYAIPFVPGHIAPDPFEDLLLYGFDAFATPDNRGDLAAGRQEMRLSGYDADGDGRCDDRACSNVLVLTGSDDGGLAERVASDLEGLGISLRIEETSESPFGRCKDPLTHVGLCVGIGWIPDFSNGSQIFPGLFGSEADCEGSTCGNMFRLGSTAEELESWGYEGEGVVNVDDRIERCLVKTGQEQFACWADLDLYLMTEVVPMIPIAEENTARIFSERVRGFTVDEFMTMPSLDHIALRGGGGEPPDPVTSFGPAPALPTGEPGIPDGGYETTISVDDARAVGFHGTKSCFEDDREWFDSAGCLAGTYRLTVEEGRWTWDQESGFPSCLWFPPGFFDPTSPVSARGRIVEVGRQVTLLITTYPCRGAPVTVRASLAGDSLTFQLISTTGAVDPWFRVIFESHPWEKVA